MNLLRRFSNALVAWVLPRPRFTLALAFLSAAASIWVAAARLQVQTAQLQLVSPNLPLIARSDMLDKFKYLGKSKFVLVIRAPDQERAIEFVKAMAAKIKADPEHFKGIFYRINPDEFKKWLLYYLGEDDLVHIRDTLSQNRPMVSKLAADPDLLNFFELVDHKMASEMVSELFTGFLEEHRDKTGRMDLEFLIKVLQGLDTYISYQQYVSPWSSFFKSGAWDLKKKGYFWQDKKKLLLASVVARKIPGKISNTESSLAQLRADIGKVRAAGFSDVQAGVTGQDALNNDEMSSAMSDMAKATWFSLLGVLLIMALFFRGLRHPLIIVTTLAVALCWTFGWTAIFIGHLNILSIVFAPMLCGLGVDYAIHWFARYEEEKDLSGPNRSEIISNVADKSGAGIILAGLGTGVSFFSFVLTGFRGLMELGMITGMGILFTILADFTVLPALSCRLASKKRSPAKSPRRLTNNGYLLRLSPAGVRTVLALALGLSVGAALTASRVGFDLNPLRLQAKNSQSVRWEMTLVKTSTHVISAALITDSAKKTLSESAKFKALPAVASVDNIFRLLPGNQEAKIPLLRSIARMVPRLKPSIVRQVSQDNRGEVKPAYKEALIDTLEKINFKMQPKQASKWGASMPQVQQMSSVRYLIDNILQSLKHSPSASERLSGYRDHFDKDLADQWSLIRQGASASPMSVRDIPPQLEKQFLHGNHYLIRIYPKGSIWNETGLTNFVKELRSVNPNVIGDPISLYVFATAFKKASLEASIYALVAIALLLAATFRSIRLMLISLIPLLAGTLWTVGIMGAAGFNFNLANTIFMPLVVGAGVEYGVIIIQRWRENRSGQGRLPFSTGKGIILAALTTTIGFGVLMIARNRGIFSLGFVAWEGSICVLAAALLILPAVLSFMRRP